MTNSREQGLMIFANVVVSLVSLFFYLEGGGAPGWKTGVATLMLSVVCGIDIVLNPDSNKFYRFSFGVFALFFLIVSIKNFLAH